MKTMRHAFFAGLFIIATLLARAADDSAAKTDLAKLQGTWLMVSGTADGQAIPDALVSQAKRVCKDDEITVTMGDLMIMKARITLDPAKKAKTIDFQMTDGATKGKRQLGIYELDGDTLKSCFAAPDAERPVDFTSKPGDMRTSTVWKRETKPAQAALPARPPAPVYPVNPDSLPQEGVPKGKLEGPFLFRSQIFTNTVRQYWVFVPAQYTAAKPACVLMFQDGQRATRTNGSLRVPQVMENLIAKKQMPVTIGIFITPGARGEEYVEVSGGNPNNRSIEYDSLGDTYARFIIDEMLPEVGKTYNLTKDPEGRAIGGTSSGAICAFNVAWERPDQFRKVISCIGSFTDIRGGHVYPQRIRDSEKKPIRVFIEDTLNDNRGIGRDGTYNPKRDWHLQNEAMVAALKEKGYDFTHVFAEGVHSDAHGGSIMSDMLRWLWRDYPK